MAGGKLISTGVEFPDATTQTTSGLPLTGGALTGAVTTTSTFDGRDVAADGVTADAALPKAGGTMTGDVSLGDNIKAKFGAGNDLQIYSDGTSSYIKETSGAGSLFVDADFLTFRSVDGTETKAKFQDNGYVKLYHNNAQKLATTSTGVDVTGSVTCDGFTSTGIDDNATSTAMTIENSGRVLIGRTSTVGYQLDVYGDALFERAGTSATHIVIKNANGNVGTITSSGTSTSYNTSSDYRLKENVVPMTGSIDRLKELKPSRFNFIADADTTVDGFLAHEAGEVVPECATGTKDAMKDEEYEVTPAVMDGETVVTEAVMGTRSVPDYQGIDQSKLTPLLVAALQEAVAKIEALEARVTALEV